MNPKTFAKSAAVGLLMLGANILHAAVLGPFTFNDLQFGNTLLESDGGGYRSGNWLNVVNTDPGNPGALTGANFNTGIANIGLSGTPTYTIGYGTAILNGAGNDFGVVSARYSSNDTFTLSVSTDGINFTAPVAFGPGLAFASGVSKNYFYNSGGPYSANLFVTPVDLSAFGLGSGASVVAIRVTSMPEGDLIRIAGLVPEPGTLSLALAGACSFLYLRKRRNGSLSK